MTNSNRRTALNLIGLNTFFKLHVTHTTSRSEVMPRLIVDFTTHRILIVSKLWHKETVKAALLGSNKKGSEYPFSISCPSIPSPFCVWYTPNAFCPQMHFGASKRVLGSQIPKCISGRLKCISWLLSTRNASRDDQANSRNANRLPNAFRCVQIHLGTSQRGFHSALPSDIVSRCILWCLVSVSKCI